MKFKPITKQPSSRKTKPKVSAEAVASLIVNMITLKYSAEQVIYGTSKAFKIDRELVEFAFLASSHVLKENNESVSIAKAAASAIILTGTTVQKTHQKFAACEIAKAATSVFTESKELKPKSSLEEREIVKKKLPRAEVDSEEEKKHGGTPDEAYGDQLPRDSQTLASNWTQKKPQLSIIYAEEREIEATFREIDADQVKGNKGNKQEREDDGFHSEYYLEKRLQSPKVGEGGINNDPISGEYHTNLLVDDFPTGASNRSLKKQYNAINKQTMPVKNNDCSGYVSTKMMSLFDKIHKRSSCETPKAPTSVCTEEMIPEERVGDKEDEEERENVETSNETCEDQIINKVNKEERENDEASYENDYDQVASDTSTVNSNWTANDSECSALIEDRKSAFGKDPNRASKSVRFSTAPKVSSKYKVPEKCETIESFLEEVRLCLEELFSEGVQFCNDFIKNRQETTKGIRRELGIVIFELISNEDFNTVQR